MPSDEFVIPDYNEEIEIIKKQTKLAKNYLIRNNIESIPHINIILDRELDAVLDNLIMIDHYHSAARCVRTALELAAKNLYFGNYPSKIGGPSTISFSDKFPIKRLTHRTESPLLNLVSDGVMSEDLFLRFREVYKDLSGFVHHRITYELAHTLPHIFPSTQHYSTALKMATSKEKEEKIVKATLIKYQLNPALQVLIDLLAVIIGR